MESTFFRSPEEFRAWLTEHHDTQRELWVGFHKQHALRTGISWAEAVDEALCFGWIDGVRKRIDEQRYAIRFSRRRAHSVWSSINLARVEELTRLGRMHAAGLAARAAADPQLTRQYSYETRPQQFDAADEARFRADAPAWAFFEAQAPSYRRAAVWWVVSAKQAATRERRLTTLIDDSAHSRRLRQLARAPGQDGAS